MLEILERIVEGNGQDGDIELLLELADTISATALCGLGKAAAFPVVSTIKNFREEYEAHIYDLCKGCSKCARSCPVGAITGKVKANVSSAVHVLKKTFLSLLKAGIKLPTFCYHSELSVYGACRMCMVENEWGGLDAACSTKIPENDFGAFACQSLSGLYNLQ